MQFDILYFYIAKLLRTTYPFSCKLQKFQQVGKELYKLVTEYIVEFIEIVCSSMLTVGLLSVAVNDTTVGTIPGRYFASTQLSLTCSVNVPEEVDADNFTITEFWSGPGGPISSDYPYDSYIITPATVQPGDSNTYGSTLRIDFLVSTGSDSNSGTYSCNMTLTLTGDYPNIQPPTTSGVDQFELMVEGNAISYNYFSDWTSSVPA